MQVGSNHYYQIKMKRKLIITMGILILTISTQAQHTITGRVIQSDNNPVSYSTVVVLGKDSSLVKGTTTDSKGLFFVGGIKEGTYILKVSSVGYTTSYKNIITKESNINVDDILITESSIQLNEVEVKGSSIIQKIDRMLIVPGKIAQKNAYNPFDLLFNMGIPHLCINPISKDLSVNGGGVQLRINGIKATTEEVTALLPKDIIRIEMIENPGERYGDTSLGAVLNIIVHHRQTGGMINIQTTNSPHVLFGENNIAAKFNQGKAQWGINYTLGYRGIKKSRTDRNEMFYLQNETIHRIQQGVNDRSSWTDQNIDLSYNYSDPQKYVFNAVLKNNIYNAPHQDETNKLFNASNTNSYIYSKLRSNNRKYTPALDLYFQHQLPKQQTLTLNLTGTAIGTESERAYKENTANGNTIADIVTNVEGDKRSIIGEAIYDKRFTSILFSVGIRHYQMHTKNKYSGTSPVTSKMDQMRSSSFVEIQGIFKKVSYGLSAGITRSYFKESGLEHTYYTFAPVVRLAFTPHKNGYFSFRFNTDPQIPSLSLLTNVEQAIDTIQVVSGNPLLKPYNTYNNFINYSYNKDKLILLLNINHSYSKNCIMESVFTDGNKIVSMNENQRSYQSLEIYPSIILRGLTLFGIQNCLTLSIEAGEAFHHSNGNRYSHSYKNFFYNSQFIMAYKEFALLGQFSKNKNVLLGETIFKGENQTAFLTTWTHKRLQLGTGILFPFTNNYKTGRERLSSVAPYTSWNYVKEAGQMVVIRFNYNFEFGTRHSTSEKRMNNKDNDNGVIKFND